MPRPCEFASRKRRRTLQLQLIHANHQTVGDGRQFHVADLSAQGEVLLEADYTYAGLERLPVAQGLIVRCATLLWRSPDGFEFDLPGDDGATVHLRWRRCASGAGVLTIRAGGVISTLSLLASGLDPEGDSQTLHAFQQHLVSELHDTGSEPAFSLLDLAQRPLLATILLFPARVEAARLLVGLIDRCFAAAFFRCHDLA